MGKTYDVAELVNKFGANLGSAGYQKLPSGLLIQWGTDYYYDSDGSSGTLINLPITFPNTFLKIIGSDNGGGAHTVSFQVNNTSSFKCWGRDVVTDSYSTTLIQWIAIGY